MTCVYNIALIYGVTLSTVGLKHALARIGRSRETLPFSLKKFTVSLSFTSKV